MRIAGIAGIAGRAGVAAIAAHFRTFALSRNALGHAAHRKWNCREGSGGQIEI